MLAVSVVIKVDKYIDDLLALASAHGIQYSSRKNVNTGTLFVFNFPDGHEQEKDAFFDAIPVEWI